MARAERRWAKRTDAISAPPQENVAEPLPPLAGTPEPCGCGSPLPALQVRRRAADVLKFRADNGADVTITALTLSAASDGPVVLKDQDNVVVAYGTADSFPKLPPADALARA